ncbi:MAG: hypothetical protein ACE5IK_09955, partial [Acidobacteriota bacterium]
MSPPSSRTRAAIGAVLALLVVGVLVGFRALSQTGDSLAYAGAIRSGARLWHPHHLLFSPIVRVLYLALRSIGLGVDAIVAAQIHNAVWAAVA